MKSHSMEAWEQLAKLDLYFQTNFVTNRFNEEMEKLKSHSMEAWEWLAKLDPKQWT